MSCGRMARTNCPTKAKTLDRERAEVPVWLELTEPRASGGRGERGKRAGHGGPGGPI